MAGLYNAALTRPVFSSSVYRNGVPYLANDEIFRCFHSQNEDYPWWAVDLGEAMSIYTVDFTKRGNCCGMTKSIPAFVIVALVEPSHLTGAFAQSGRSQNVNIESFRSSAALLIA